MATAMKSFHLARPSCPQCDGNRTCIDWSRSKTWSACRSRSHPRWCFTRRLAFGGTAMRVAAVSWRLEVARRPSGSDRGVACAFVSVSKNVPAPAVCPA